MGFLWAFAPQIYGSQFFHVEPQMNVDLPDEVFLAVNPRGILIINPETKDVLVEHPYSEVPTWGHSGLSFVLHIGNLLKQTKLYFQVRPLGQALPLASEQQCTPPAGTWGA